MSSCGVTAAGYLLLLLLPLEAVLAQSGWNVTYNQPVNICAVRGSTVVFSSTYVHPDHEKYKESFWFIATVEDPMGTKLSYSTQSSLFKNTCDNNKTCTLTISNVTQRNAAEYRFRFFTETLHGKFTRYPGVQLNVSDLQISVRRSYQDSRPYTLSCDIQCNLTSQQNFTWYVNNQSIGYGQTIDRATIQAGDQYTCSVSGSHVLSPAVYAPKTPTVSTNFSLNITEEHQVNLTCHSDANPPANYSWFKRNQDLHHYHPELTIQWVQSSDEYSCRAENLLGESTIHITCEKLNGDINCSSSSQDPVHWKWPLVRAALAVLLLFFLLVVFLLICKKKSTSRKASEDEDVMGNEETVPADAPEENLNYASVHFTKRSSDPLYSTIRTPKRSTIDENEDRAEYALIVCRTAGTASSP